MPRRFPWSRWSRWSWRRAFLVFAAASVASCGKDNDDGYPFGAAPGPTKPAPPSAGGSGSDDDTHLPAALHCGPTWDDDLDLEGGARVDLPSEGNAITTVVGRTIVCGDGFVVLVDEDGEPTDTLEVDGECTALTGRGSSGVVAGFADGRVALLEISDDALRVGADADVSGRVRALATLGDRVYVAAGGNGLRVGEGDLDALHTVADVSEAYGVAVASGGVLVAAGEAGIIRLGSDDTIADTLPTGAPALGIVTHSGRAVVLEGAHGFEVLAVADTMAVVAGASTRGVVVDAAFAGDDILTAQGHALLRHRLDGGALESVGTEHRRDRGRLVGGWIRAVATVGTGFVVLHGDAAVPVTVDRRESAPDLWVDVPSVSMTADPGEIADAAYLVKNIGTEDLVLGPPIAQGGPFTASLHRDDLERVDDCDDLYALAPGQSAIVNLEFTPVDGTPVSGTLVLRSNDPDDAVVTIPIDANRREPAPGTQAPDFTALTVDGDLFRLSDHRGDVVLLKLFNFGCSTCAEEFPAIEDDLLADFDDLVAVGVNTSHRTAYAATLAADADLRLPMVLDLDSEAFRAYRIPSAVFPLHVVIDRDGSIVDINNDKGIDAIRDAVDKAY